MPRDWAAMKALTRDVRIWLKARGISDGVQYVAEVVLEEMLANAVEHGGQGEVSVATLIEGQRIVLCFEDTGPAFDPASQPPRFPQLDSCGTGGLGLHHVRALAQDMKYERIGVRNVVTVIVDRRLALPSSLHGAGQ